MIKKGIGKIKNGLRFVKHKLVSIKDTVPTGFDYSYREYPTVTMQVEACYEELSQRPLIAVQVHVFFIEVMDEICEEMNKIPYPYDCYISTDSEEKQKYIEKIILEKSHPEHLQIKVFENRGRDVAPFLVQMGEVYQKYKYIAHIHTKKSEHTNFGDCWRKFLLYNLFGSRENVLTLIDMFEKDEKLGLITTEVYPIVRKLLDWDATKADVEKLLGRMGISTKLNSKPICPVGDMFWARTEAIAPLLGLNLTQKDFQEEAGQLNYTLAHVIERIWIYLVSGNGYKYKIVINGINEKVTPAVRGQRLTIWARKAHKSSKVDALFVKALKEISGQLVIVEAGNGDIRSAWKHYIAEHLEILQKNSQVVFACDNSLGAVWGMQRMFRVMKEKNASIWTVLQTKLRQADFIVIDKSAWKTKEDLEAILDSDEYAPAAYVEESNYIKDWLGGNEVDKELAYDFIVLGAPILSKESKKHLRKGERKILKKVLKQIPFCEEIAKFY